MWNFVLFLRDCFKDISSMLNSFDFEIGNITVSILDILIGLLAMGIIMSVFWKGART